MKSERDLELPLGTSVYCCPHGLILDFTWSSCRGTHIVRAEVPLAFCEPEQRAALRAAARNFCRVVAAERRR